MESTKDSEVYTVENAETTKPFNVATRTQALEAASHQEEDIKDLSWATILSIFFLGISGAGPIALGFVIVSSMLGAIGTALGGDQSLLIWVVSGWSIASAVCFSLAGNLSDIFGRRWVILAGNALCVIGSIVGGTATSISGLLAAEILQGAACGLTLVIYAAIPELLPHKYRGIGLAWTELVLDDPWLALAALLAQLMAQRASWRLAFWINLAYGGVSFVGIAAFYYPPSRPKHDFERSRWQQVKELDYPAYFLFAGGLTTFLIGLSWASTTGHPWRSASVIAPIVIGALVFLSAFLYDWVFVPAERAMLPLHLLKLVRKYTLQLVVIATAGAIFYPMASLLTRATIIFYAQDATQIGIIQIPNGFGQLFGSTVLVSSMSITKRPKWHVLTAVTIQGLFVALYAYAIPNSKTTWMAFQFFGQACFPWITACTVVMTGLHVRQIDVGIAIGLLGTCRSLGGAIGNSLFGAILNGSTPGALRTHIGKVAATAGIASTRLAELVEAVEGYATGDPQAFTAFPGLNAETVQALMEAYRGAWAHGFRLVFYSTIPLSVLALVCAFFIEDVSDKMNKNVSIHLEKDVLAAKTGDEHEDKH